ncbi:molybdate ABC transporter substrate-binding protein [Microbacterium enclense]|uniref:Molybdate ABC transporter substrate-binding protein n=1 Tax=Microbacterium enclense TaxID=993073 RepID=A0A3S3P5L0_9MICO|nr:molybdate ABC transporter substrate-binding protein [Microbacterium enclense]RWR20047.1 molybdate ABC transporter substrate-binding protein [Microbacterium enclense]
MRRPRLILALAAALTLAGCAAPSAPTGSAGAVSGTVEVYAAASLQRAFDEIAVSFEQAHPEIDVATVYDGSRTLATQIQQGAPADVFASADEKSMAGIGDLALDPRVFAANTLVIAVPAGNPGAVAGLADLARVPTVLCASEVPCGAAAATLLQNAGVSVTPVSAEQNVTAVLTKVTAGDAQAGLVYATDLAGRDDVDGVVPDGADAVVNRYPITAVRDAANPAAAAAFMAFVLSDEGRRILSDAGFRAP